MKYSDKKIQSFLKTKEKFLTVSCEVCKKDITKKRRYIQRNRKRSNHVTCSGSCARQLSATGKNFVRRDCPACSKPVRRTLTALKRSKSKNIFCSSSCSTHYNNLRRPVGLRRSALEIWIEKKLKELYPNLKMTFNHKNVIGSELDIYVPEFKMAFELNGFFHYYRITKDKYGSFKLRQTKKNDLRKAEACKKAGIDLTVINTSKMGHFTFSKSSRYLKPITKKIDKILNYQK